MTEETNQTSSEDAGAGDGASEDTSKNVNANPDNETGENGGDSQNNAQGEGGDSNNDGDVDYKEKFGHSTSENQKLSQHLKDNGIDPITGKKIEGGDQGNGQDSSNNNISNNAQAFTDEELESAIPGFAHLSAEEKENIRNAKNTAKDLKDIKRTVAELYDEREFGRQLADAKKNPNNKLIVDNEEEFKAFAYKEENLKIPFKNIVDSFILEKMRNGGGGNTETKTKTNKKGMESSTHGNKSVTGNKAGKVELSAQDAATLRKEDPRRYNELASKRNLVILKD